MCVGDFIQKLNSVSRCLFNQTFFNKRGKHKNKIETFKIYYKMQFKKIKNKFYNKKRTN